MSGDPTFADVLAANAAYAQTASGSRVWSRSRGARTGGAHLHGLAHRAARNAGLEAQGDAKIVRNAGARVTEDALRTFFLGPIPARRRGRDHGRRAHALPNGWQHRGRDARGRGRAAGGPDTAGLSFLVAPDQMAARCVATSDSPGHGPICAAPRSVASSTTSTPDTSPRSAERLAGRLDVGSELRGRNVLQIRLRSLRQLWAAVGRGVGLVAAARVDALLRGRLVRAGRPAENRRCRAPDRPRAARRGASDPPSSAGTRPSAASLRPRALLANFLRIRRRLRRAARSASPVPGRRRCQPMDPPDRVKEAEREALYPGRGATNRCASASRRGGHLVARASQPLGSRGAAARAPSRRRRRA